MDLPPYGVLEILLIILKGELAQKLPFHGEFREFSDKLQIRLNSILRVFSLNS